MNRDHYRPSAGEFEGMQLCEKLFWLSRSYLEASTFLCKAMINDDFSKQYSSSRVILHLSRHGLELFLKAAIVRATAVPSRAGHNLDKLISEYTVLYSDNRFHFNIPAAFSLRQKQDLFPDSVASFHSTLDQRHRYPADQKGQSFLIPESFDPRLFLEEIEALSKALMVIEFCHMQSGTADIRPNSSSKSKPLHGSP